MSAELDKLAAALDKVAAALKAQEPSREGNQLNVSVTAGPGSSGSVTGVSSSVHVGAPNYGNVTGMNFGVVIGANHALGDEASKAASEVRDGKASEGWVRSIVSRAGNYLNKGAEATIAAVAGAAVKGLWG